MSRQSELAELSRVYDTAPLSNRNLIINGNMEIAQRGTSQTTAGYGTIDRFALSLSGATATMTQESFTIGQTDVVGSDKFLKLAVSTGNNNSGIYYKVEAKDAFPVIGQKVTLSYYAKGTSPSNGLDVAIGWYDGSTSSPYDTEIVTLTSSWTKYTHTFDVPSISGLTLTNAAAYLEVHWIQADTDTGTSAYEVNLAQVQLEVGDTATPFEHRSFGDELLRCKRYFEKISGGSDAFSFSAKGQGSTSADATINLSVPLRASPTFNSINSRAFGDSGTFDASSSTTPTVSQFDANNPVVVLNCGGFDALTNNKIINWGPVGNALEIDAEL